MQIRRFLQFASDALTAAGIENPSLESQMIAARLLGVPRTRLLHHMNDELDDEMALNRVMRRAKGEPIAYVLEVKEFYGREFHVTRDVLIPRPETEMLVEQALTARNDAIFVDVGTGSGVIAVTLAIELPKSKVIATDLCGKAILVARKNAEEHRVSVACVIADRLRWLRPRSVDVIVSNPPYVAPDDPRLDADVRLYEPSIALFSRDGLEFISELVQSGYEMLKPGGQLIMEFGVDQESDISKLATPSFTAKFFPDLNGIPRVARFEKLR